MRLHPIARSCRKTTGTRVRVWAGRKEEAEKIAADLSERSFQQAVIFAGLGDKDRTVEALDRMTMLGPVRIGRTFTFPEMAFLRGDSRLKAIRKKFGLLQ